MSECIVKFRNTTVAISNILAIHGGKQDSNSLVTFFVVSSRADPLSQVTFASDPLHPRLVYTRRPGRPKADWVWESYKNAFMLINGQGALFNPNDIEHLRQVKTEALRRKF
jgi:hypothetical protein